MRLAATLYAEAPALPRTRAADYLQLIKPRIAVLVLFTVATGFLLASGVSPDWRALLHTLLGAALVASGASALNQLLERETDALMRRTENRPLPAGRLQAVEVALFGAALGIVGLVYLALTLPQLLAAAVAAFTLLSYVFVYTPLKRLTCLNTLIGAVPGALPPVIGWTAVRGTFDVEILALFAILFFWQVPHFLAIAWIYREDYGRAGLRMLPVGDRGGRMTSRQMVAYCLALLAASLIPVSWTGPLYLLGALVLGGSFLGFCLAFWWRRSLPRARGVLRASLIYLPLLLALLMATGLSQ
jgi:protoheme IX farnesyltransferase